MAVRFRPGAFLAVLLAAAAAARAETGVTDREIVIGSCAALEGSSKTLGTQQLDGARAYLEYINKERGGIHGRKLQLLAKNDNYEADRAIECFNSIKESVFMGAFFTGSAASAKHAPMAESNKLPIIGFISGAQFLYEPVKRYVFAVRASFRDEARELVDHLWNDVGARKIAVIYQYDAMGASLLQGINDALTKHQAAVAAQVSLAAAGGVDLDAVIKTVRAADPEVVVLSTSLSGPAAEIIKRSRASGWKPLFVNIGARDSIAKAVGKAGDGVVISQVMPSPAQTSLPLVKLYRHLLPKYSPHAELSSYYTLEGFVDAVILVEALKRAGKDLTREKLVDTIESMRDFDAGLGANMRVNFSAQQHAAFDKVFFTVIRNGESTPMTDWVRIKAGKTR